jgi:hypothetical protein
MKQIIWCKVMKTENLCRDAKTKTEFTGLKISKENENSGHMYIEKYLSFVASLDKVFK